MAELEGASIALSCAHRTLACNNVQLAKADAILATCAGCKLQEAVPAFTAAVIKRWLAKHCLQKRDKCNDCVFRACAACSTYNRPLRPAPASAYFNSKYIAMSIGTLLAASVAKRRHMLDSRVGGLAPTARPKTEARRKQTRTKKDALHAWKNKIWMPLANRSASA